MKRLVCIAIAVLIAAASLAGCAADDSYDKVAINGALRVGITSFYIPLAYINDDGNPMGFDVDFATVTSKIMGLTARFIPYDTMEALEQALLNGEIDCIWSGYAINDERLDKFSFSRPYMGDRSVYIVKPGTDVSKLNAKNTGVLAGSDETRGKPYSGYNDILVALDDDEIAGGIVDIYYARYMVYLFPDSYEISEIEGESAQYFAVAVRKGELSLLEAIQEGIDKAYFNGQTAKYSAQWFGENLLLDNSGESR